MGEARVGWALLSPREAEVARLVADDLSDKTIANILQISRRTVQRYLDNIARKICSDQSPLSRRRCVRRWVDDTEHSAGMGTIAEGTPTPDGRTLTV